MTAMGLTRTVPPDNWVQTLEGVWIRILRLPDPLLGADLHRVEGHRDNEGRVWVRVHGNNAGVLLQSVPPDDHDFANMDGGPL